VVGRIEIHTDREWAADRKTMHDRAIRAEGLGQRRRRATVQQAEGLGVAFDRHRAHHPLGGHLQDGDPDPLGERSRLGRGGDDRGLSRRFHAAQVTGP
jgi:hypothetical protein